MPKITLHVPTLHAVVAVLLLAAAASPRAADFGNAMMLYQSGHYADAVKEFGTLAAQGDAEAQFILGDMYANGQGVVQDFVQAHKWYNLAAAHGARGAARVRDDLAARMTAEQVAEAQKLAREWKPGEPATPAAAPEPAKPTAPPGKSKPAAPAKPRPDTAPPPAPAPAREGHWAATGSSAPAAPAPAAPPATAAAPAAAVAPASPAPAPAQVATTVPPTAPAQTPSTTSSQTSGGGFFANLARGATGLFGGNRAPTAQRSATATIGIRGLSAEELRAAGPNPVALQKMEGYAVNQVEAAFFAREANLATRTVEYLSPPSPPAGTSDGQYRPFSQ